jgi:endonuclease/exonuclease/phosphatase family metal-dependent hydrolase
MAATSPRTRISRVAWDLPGLFGAGECSSLSADLHGLGDASAKGPGGANQPMQGSGVLLASGDVQLERDRPLNLPPRLLPAAPNASRVSADWSATPADSRDVPLLARAVRPVPVTVGGASASSAPALGVLSFNVLAPVWAAPTWYPQDLDPALLDRDSRLKQTQNLLRSLAARLDVICLQEVNAPELQGYLEALGPDFTGAMAQNERDWWSNWLVPEIPWEANGAAVIVRSSRFKEGRFEDVPLPDGNHASVFQGIDTITGQKIRVQSVHLDSDRISNHKVELSALFDRYPATQDVKDILAGDFNEDTDIGTAAGLLKRAGYSNVLSGIGNFEATHPWSSSYNGNQRWGRIDHITVRHGLGLSGDVLDFGVWSIADETARISANFQNTGSDHFPVFAQLA